MNTQILEQIGLSRNEVKVFFALLELDQSTATPIVKRSGIPNSKIYPTLEKLIKKGLVSFVIKNNVRYFQASDPRNLIDFLGNKEKLIIGQKEEIEKIIPRIELKRKLVKDQQEATVYEGLDGVKVALNNILNTMQSGEEYLVFALGDENRKEQVKRFFEVFHKKRSKKGIKVRLIVNKEIKEVFTKYHLYKGTRIKYTNLMLPTGVFIFGNNVMTLVWGEKPTAFVISSKSNAERYKEFFEEIWKTVR